MPVVRYEKMPGAGYVRTEDFSEGSGRMDAKPGPLRYARPVDELRAKFEHVADLMDLEDDEVLKRFSGKEPKDFLPGKEAVQKARMPGQESVRQTLRRVGAGLKTSKPFGDDDGEAFAAALEKRGL